MRIAHDAQYQAIFDSAVEAMAVFDADGAIRSANPAVERVFGYKPAALIGRDITMLMSGPNGANDHFYGLAGLRAIAGTGCEVAGKRRDGSSFPLDLSVAEWKHRGVTCFTGVMRDISRRKLAEASLANREAHLANLYAQAGAGLAETDRAGAFVSVNDRYCEIVGRDRAELMTMRIQDLIHPDDLQHNLPFYTRLATAADGRLSIEERYLRGDGAVAWVTKTASPIRVERAEPITLIVAIDITERKLAETALRESEEKLRLLQNEFAHLARVTDLGEMATAIAHEINQPLTAISNYLSAGLMTKKGQSEAAALTDARTAMKRAAEQGLRAGSIVRGLREFVGKGASVRRIEQPDMLVGAAMALALLDAGPNGIVVEHRAGAGTATIEVDAVQIEQVLVNLMRNSIDAMSNNGGHAERRLTIASRDVPSEGVVEFCVADTGTGIAPEMAGRLFEPFVTTKAKGMGMGLSVCRRIVEAHGGSINLENGDGGGACFKIRLPRIGSERRRRNSTFH